MSRDILLLHIVCDRCKAELPIFDKGGRTEESIAEKVLYRNNWSRIELITPSKEPPIGTSRVLYYSTLDLCPKCTSDTETFLKKKTPIMDKKASYINIVCGCDRCQKKGQ